VSEVIIKEEGKSCMYICYFHNGEGTISEVVFKPPVVNKMVITIKVESKVQMERMEAN
jgi:hypothetical protein